MFRIDARTNRATRDAARADLEAALLNAERYKSLLEIKAVSQQDYDLAKARAKQAQAAMIRAEEDLANALVPAAISGHIGRTMVSEGAYVSKADATPLATIEQIDPIYANFSFGCPAGLVDQHHLSRCFGAGRGRHHGGFARTEDERYRASVVYGVGIGAG